MRTLAPAAALTAALFAAAGGAATAVPAQPAERAEEPLIVFERRSGTHAHLYAVRPDGSGLRRISDGGAEHDPAWTRDGRGLVYVTTEAGLPDVAWRNLAGTRRHLLTRRDRTVERYDHDAAPDVAHDGTVVFVRRSIAPGVDRTDLFTVALDAAGERRLTTHAGRESVPAFAPDARRRTVLYERGGWVHELRDGRARRVVRGTEPAVGPGTGHLAYTRDGAVLVRAGGRTRVVARGSHPAWSPDGRRLAYAGPAGGIFTVAYDGRGRRTVVAPAGAVDLAPAWRPPVRAGRDPVPVPAEGAVVLARTGTDARGNETSELFVDVSGVRRRLTRNVVHDAEPAWSPDRRRIAFVRGDDIWVMRHDGTGARRLPGGAAGSNGWPAWSPDGRRIAFASTRAFPPGEGAYELYLMRADGTGVRRITRSRLGRDDVAPAFSPDGRHLVYASGSGSTELFRLRLADGARTRLTAWNEGGADGGRDRSPDWSPDGRRIAYVTDKGPGWALRTIDARGGGMREVVRSTTHVPLFASWAPRGRRLLYGLASSSGEPTLHAVHEDGLMPVDLGPGDGADW